MTIVTRFGPISAVAFDLDGTLVDSIATAFARFKEVVEENGVRFTPEMDAHFRENGGWIAALSDRFGVAQPLLGRIAHSWELSCTAETSPLFDGALATLDWLRERELPLFILTARFRPSTLRLLHSLGIADRFARVVTHHDVMAPKPHADAFLPILTHLAWKYKIPLRECLFVGDTFTDFKTGENAGIRTVIVKNGDFSTFDGEDHTLHDNHVISSIKELPAWLERNEEA